MTSENVARDSKGRFANSGHSAEAAARDAKRYPTTRHVGPSVGASTGTLRGLGVATAAQQRSYERRAKR